MDTAGSRVLSGEPGVRRQLRRREGDSGLRGNCKLEGRRSERVDSYGDGSEKGPRARRWGQRGKGGGRGSLGGVVSPGAGAGRLQPGREPPLLRVRPARGHLRGYHRGQLRLYHLLGTPVSGPARGAGREGVVESRRKGQRGSGA